MKKSFIIIAALSFTIALGLFARFQRPGTGWFADVFEIALSTVLLFIVLSINFAAIRLCWRLLKRKLNR